MVDIVKCRFQVGVEHPQAFGVLTFGRFADGYDRVMTAPAGAKTVGLRSEPCFPFGIPSGRRFPFLFGTYARLTGLGLHGAEWCCIQSASSALDWGSSAVLPSMPAVLRPALTSVTRRTLISVLARERSISFCRFLTLARSPACDAAKMRCRSRRTSFSTCRQSISAQSVKTSSGPFTEPTRSAEDCAIGASHIAIVSNLPFDSGFSVNGSSQAHQIHVSTLSGRGTAPIRPVIQGPPADVPEIGPPFPAAFRPPAFACWIFLRPLRDWAFLTVCLPDCCLDLIGVVTFRMCEMRPGWVPSVPRERWCTPDLLLCPRSAPAAFQRLVPILPLVHPIERE